MSRPAAHLVRVPAVSHLPVSSPAVLGPFAALNEGRPYAAQVKPFGFLSMGHVDPLTPLPPGLVPGTVTPVAPYTSDPDELLGLHWRNRHDGRPLSVTTRRRPTRAKSGSRPSATSSAAHAHHPETKSGDPRGGLGRRGSVGVLPRA